MRWLSVLTSILLLTWQVMSGVFIAGLRPAPDHLTAIATPTPTVSIQQEPISIADPGFSVRFHPDGPLYAGDLISIEVIAPPGMDLRDREVAVQLETVIGRYLSTARFAPYGIAGRLQATLTWVWDTSGLEDRDYNLRFAIEPEGTTWIETVHLEPAWEVPPPEPHARWATRESTCCVIHFITGTASARDIDRLLEVADKVAQTAMQQMEGEFAETIPITIVPRVLGHGGFAADEIYVSYLDRNYAGNDFSQVLHHEMIHILDRRKGGDLRPSILVEGLAVYYSGGHFKKEPLFPRAAALLQLGWYIPLKSLADSFYTSQHEIGYLEGAALVQYLINSFGYARFEAFYRDIHPPSDEQQSTALDLALQKHFSLSLDQLEKRFLSALYRQHINPDLYEDLRLTVAYYDTVRRYQQQMVPSAYFLTAWLPEGKQMRERGIVADYLRKPADYENITIENLLVEADRALRFGNYRHAEELLNQINATLNREEFIEPLGSPVLAFLPGRLGEGWAESR